LKEKGLQCGLSIITLLFKAIPLKLYKHRFSLVKSGLVMVFATYVYKATIKKYTITEETIILVFLISINLQK